jgi:polyadenylation factor subunit 2
MWWQLCKVFDIRMLKDLQTFRGHLRDCTTASWHPVHEELFVSGGYDGSMLYWQVGEEGGPVAEVRGGHEAAIWSLAWNPLGHILCTGSNDNTAKFWSRNRTGEVPRYTVSYLFMF